MNDHGNSTPVWPRVGVGAVIWKDDRFLLIKRGKPPRLGEWSLPGGRQEAGETVAEAVLREILEETCLTIEIIELAAVVDLIDRTADKILYHYTVIDMWAEWRSGEAQAGDDALAVAWLSLEELARIELPAQQRHIIEAVAAKRRSLA